ncbi:mitogen-activated kinase kinase kinase YODA-like [Olea europaea subsp. europaea]|uniref:mitogen-activated protein kinase kinase kinase n=1 Tax=Olea europaea subsp. europaea TaxID=158383 RepID=A0A8S0UYT2_OLEEU|nr:mitogen-activated kinase kinase kinase YODA-like [Olea europaea subsp. europaea]
MHFLWSAFSSSSSSSSPSNPPLKGKSKSSNDIFKNNSCKNNEQGRKLTRQRKLRHATDDELGLRPGVFNERSQSCPVSPDSSSAWRPASEPRTPRRADVGHWSKSAVPQPLPLPELNSQPKQIDNLHGQRRGDLGHSSSAIESSSSLQNLGKTKDNIARRSSVSPTYRYRKFPRQLNVDTAQNNFRLHFPTFSAPSSGYSSPILSPQRFSTVDFFQVSAFALESSHSDRIAKSCQISPRLTPNQSPLQSPCRNSVNHNGNLMHLHNKSFPESWPEGNNAHVHPLPLPPGVSRPSPTASQNSDKSDILSVKGQWRKGRLIGRGTYGSVYVATHCETGATCAMKEVEMIPDDPKYAECIKQLEQEIRILEELKHPNIVQYYGCEKIEDRFCIYLEYVHPGSINKYISEHCGVMTECIVRNFTRHILLGLAYLHNKQTIHRDIKGANLLVNASGVVKLADFGLAKHLNGNGIDLSLKGTPHWMAPEVLQAVMRNDANPELAFGIDIWSVGCTVVEMLTGKPPWSELNGVQAMFNVLNKSPPIPETLSNEGKDFLRRCFQRRPADRPSATKLLEHPFLRSSQDQNVGGFMQEFSRMKLLDAPQFPSDRTKGKKDVMPHSSDSRIQHGKLPLNASSETSPQSYPESSCPGIKFHHSPRSMLEVLTSVASPDLNRGSYNTSPSKVPNSLFSGTGANSPYTVLRNLPFV